MKFLRCLIVAAVSVLPAVVQAETDYIAMPKITSIQNGLDNADQIKTLRVHDNATIGGTLNVAGSATYSNAVVFKGGVTESNVTIQGGLKLAQSSLSVTSGQIIVFAGCPVIPMTAAGADLTVTCTVAAVAAGFVSNQYTLINVGASNSILITDAAPVYNSGATLGTNDVSSYYVYRTNYIAQTSTMNN